MVSRCSAEIGTAIATAALGLIVMVGALEFGIGWGTSGPGAGTFPFYIGLMVTAASAVTLVQAILRRGALQTTFLDWEKGRRVVSFFVPVLLFVVVALVFKLGLYVAAALYLTFVMKVQGGYRLAVAAIAGLGVAAAFFVLLEILFQVPLMKGPLEAAMGIY